ncbi:MAG: hypothetical protein JXR73_00405 [Candidatus Omnitrophica bacterium]|nr:hypothetical protein [Candidatus Omnitrophota bacterium]
MIRFSMMGFVVILSIGAWAYDASIDEDGMLRVDGKRQFIIGLYEQAPDDAFAEEISKAGFNLIRAGDSREALDRAAKYGLQCWIPLSGLAVQDDPGASRLREIVNAWKSHPALSIWEAPDEALWNVWWLRWNRAVQRWSEVDQAIRKYQGEPEQVEALKKDQAAWRRYRSSGRYGLAEDIEDDIRMRLGMAPAEERLSEWHTHLPELYDQLKKGCQIVRECDPDHVLWFNHAPRNTMNDLTLFGRLADIVGCDIYPVPFGPQVGHSDLTERNLASVGRYTERMAQSAPGKPVWMVLQGFGWDDLSESPPTEERPRPTLAQTRFMAYDAIVNGARGILYWGTYRVNKDSQLWADLKQTASELHSIEPLLSAPDANESCRLTLHHTSASDENSVRWLIKKQRDSAAIILANESSSPLAFDIDGLESWNGRAFKVLGEEETLLVQNGKLSFGLPALSAAVLLNDAQSQ